MELPRACGLGARQKSPLQHFDPPDNTFHLYLPTITIGSALTCASSPVLVLARYHRERSILCEKRVCLVSASIGRSILENADSARRCRFRKSQQKRASDLDSIYGWIPKLDVAGSNPVSSCTDTSFDRCKATGYSIASEDTDLRP